MSSKEPAYSERRQLVRDSIVGFIGFFAFLSVVQAVINVLQPEPKVWPAALALVLVIAAVTTYRATRPPRYVDEDLDAE